MEWTCPRCGKSGITGNFCEICNTPKPPIKNATTTQVPEPTPGPSPELTPEPSRVLRFEEHLNADGSKTIIDRENGYTINYTDTSGYIAYNGDGKEVYHIYPDGKTCIKIYNNGDSGSYDIVNYDGLTIKDMSTNMKVMSNGDEYYIDNGNLIKIVNYDNLGRIYSTKICAKDGNSYIEYFDGSIDYLDRNGYRYKSTYYDESSGLYGWLYGSFDTHIPWLLDSDGTYGMFNDKDEYEEVGTYTYDENGNIVLKNKDGTILYTDFYGDVIQKVTADGVIYNYNLETSSQNVTKNGKIMYSKTNHIEYEEEEYYNILTTLNNVGDINKSAISSACSNINSAVSSFPDPYSVPGLDGIEDNISGYIDLISSLAETINYSLLAYQTCDEELRNGLYLLIDSLFGENDSQLANNFKNIINSSIEDRDSDKILEYKANTNFKYLSENAIVSETYIDNDNNKWYLNKLGHVLSVDGDNIKINYGGETFDLEFDKSGYAILKDSNGNSLNIFGDYNLDSVQFGGSQSDLPNAYSNQYVIDILQKYFPDSNMEEKIALLDKAGATGCGYTAVTDFVFKDFEGNEKGFYDTFGYPMYEFKKNGDEITVDYNYEPLIMDLYCYCNSDSGKFNIGETTLRGCGTNLDTLKQMVEYLTKQYNVTIENSSDLVFVGDYGYSLYDLDGSLYVDDGGSHIMVVTGIDEDGNKLVSSWGNKWIYVPSANINYQ